jgi:adenylylsulfate kinase-like enzyme
MPSSLLITGTTGVGKTATASAISALLRSRGTPHALVDLDRIRDFCPASTSDPHNEELGLLNLAAVAKNYRAAGADVLIIATAVESAAMCARLAHASGVDEGDLAVVRLVAPAEVVQARLESRAAAGGETADEVAWSKRRAPELEAIMEEAEIPGAVVSADAPLLDVAARALRELEEL